MQSQDLDENQRTSVLRKISELVDLFYKALDADKSGEEVHIDELIPKAFSFLLFIDVLMVRTSHAVLSV